MIQLGSERVIQFIATSTALVLAKSSPSLPERADNALATLAQWGRESSV